MKWHNYNNWHMRQDYEDDYLAHLCAHDLLTTSEVMDSVLGLDIDVARGYNPDIKMYRHYEMAVWNRDNESHPDERSYPIPKTDIDSNNWWLRYADGTKVTWTDPEGPWAYDFIDVGKSGVAEAYVSYSLARLPNGYSGWTWDYLSHNISYYTGGKALRDYSSEDDWRENAWLPFLEAVCDGLSSYERIGNNPGFYGDGDPTSESQRALLTGAIQEHLFCLQGFDFGRRGYPNHASSLLESPLFEWVAEWKVPGWAGRLRADYISTAIAYVLLYLPSGELAEKRAIGWRKYACDRTYSDDILTMVTSLGNPIEDYEESELLLQRRFQGGMVLVARSHMDKVSLPKPMWDAVRAEKVRSVLLWPGRGCVLVE